jgi:hypothetical protein
MIMRAREPIHNRRTNKPKRVRLLTLSFAELVRSIEAIEHDEEPYSYFIAAPDQATFERWAAIAVLRAVQKLLHYHRIYSAVLYQLILDLEAVDFPGETRAIFKPARKSGRKPDDKIVQGLKGRFAGVAYAQMHAGMSREQAASWTARNIPPAVARRVSSKPIRTCTVKEWMNQYGCSGQIRRDLKSANTQTKFEQFLTKNILSDRSEGRFGKLECLRMLYLGYESQAADKSIPFSGIFDFLQEESVLKILADWDTEFGKITPYSPENRCVISPPMTTHRRNE